MRVLSGRLTAVLVASLATIILVGILAPTTTLASNPPGLARFMDALGQAESHGNYTARNATSGAYGKYQIMPASWRAWAERYLGDANARPTPANQEIVATAKVRTLWFALRSWRRVAYWWLTGSNATAGWSPFATRYVNRVMTYYAASAATTVAPKPPPTKPAQTKPAATKPAPTKPVPTKPGVTVAIRRFSETSAAIAYTGSWRVAGHRGYTGAQARYATARGAKAVFTFTGRRVVWYGPVGPTRGRAKIGVDGAFVKTVDLYESRFSAHRALFSRTWTTAGRHTLFIQVLGTHGRPYIAIDGFEVAG